MPETLEKLLINELIPQAPDEAQEDRVLMRLWKVLTSGKGDKHDEI